jgi:hypothetical protein
LCSRQAEADRQRKRKQQPTTDAEATAVVGGDRLQALIQVRVLNVRAE